MKRLIRIFLVLLISSVYCFSGTVAAISSAELKSIYTDATYYDPLSGNGCSVPGATVPSSVGGTLSAGSSVYILGDSITEGASDEYAAAFSVKGVTTDIDASQSRSIRGAGETNNRLSGLDAATQDAEKIRAAKAIVIGLGTNGGNDSANIDALLQAIRASNQSAPIYWIDTTVIDRGDYVATIKRSNVAIYAEAPGKYTPISWFKKVTPGGDPVNPTGSETDANSYISLSDSTHVHLTNEGSKALASLVVNTLTGGGETVDPVTGAVCLTPGEDGLVGEDNIEKIYNYLLHEFTPIQVAAIMGNLQEEGGFEPKRVQYGGINCRGEVSVRNTPSSLCDTLRVDGDTGYGLAQWTAQSRQQALLDFAASKNKIPGDLLLQLDFLWQEMTTIFNNSVLTPLKATSDLRTATDIVLKKFECPQACVDLARSPTPANQAAYQRVLDRRTSSAQGILTRFGSL